MIRCEECNSFIDLADYRKLADNPLYDKDGYYIIHKSCQSSMDDEIEASGDLILVFSKDAILNE